MLRKKDDDADDLGSQGKAALKHVSIGIWLGMRRGGFLAMCLVFVVLAIMAILCVTATTEFPQPQTSMAHHVIDRTKAAFSKTAALRSAPTHRSPPSAPKEYKLMAGQPIPPHSIPNSSTPIHLVVSAFRDGSRCARTLGFALEKARNPDRVFFEVMQALSPAKGDISCEGEFKRNQLKVFCRKRKDLASCEAAVLQRLKVWTIPLDHGMGPAHQRGLLNQKRSFNESDAMCLNTDSHMDFLPDWDNITSKEWLKTNNEFAVLTTYPMAMNADADRLYAHDYVDLCGYTSEENIPRGKQGTNWHRVDSEKPYFTMNWAAGFSFYRCHGDRNVPVDLNLKWIFTGEEVSRAVRFWTSGYDLYLPLVTTVYHDYSHAKQDFWQFADQESQGRDRENSRKRLASLLQITEIEHSAEKVEWGPFGLGAQRSLEQFVEWAHFDMGSERWGTYLRSKNMKTVTEHLTGYPVSFCKTLKYAPVKDMKSLWASAFNGDPRYRNAVPPVKVLHSISDQVPRAHVDSH